MIIAEPVRPPSVQLLEKKPHSTVHVCYIERFVELVQVISSETIIAYATLFVKILDIVPEFDSFFDEFRLQFDIIVPIHVPISKFRAVVRRGNYFGLKLANTIRYALFISAISVSNVLCKSLLGFRDAFAITNESQGNPDSFRYFFVVFKPVYVVVVIVGHV